MAEQWRVLMPKTQIFGSFTQSTGQSMELDPNRRTTLRVRAEFAPTLAVGTSLVIDVQEATSNEETAFVTSPTKQITLDLNGQTQIVQPMAFSGRFVRLKIAASMGSVRWFNIQAEVLVQ